MSNLEKQGRRGVSPVSNSAPDRVAEQASDNALVPQELRALDRVVRDVYLELSRFKPIARCNDGIFSTFEYKNIALLAGTEKRAEPWSVSIGSNSIDLIYVSRGLSYEFMPKKLDVKIWGDREALPAAGDKSSALSDAEFALNVFSALLNELRAVTAPRAQTHTQSLHDAFVKAQLKVKIPAKSLEPAPYENLTARWQEIKARAASIDPVRKVDEALFIGTIAKALKARFPERTKITGEERTWDELSDHRGIDSSQFDLKYAGSNGRIDLAAVAKRTIDHGGDPIRNYFNVTLAEQGSGFVFFIHPHNSTDDALDRLAGQGLIGTYLDMYDVFIAAGLPVSSKDNEFFDALTDGSTLISLDASALTDAQISDVPSYHFSDVRNDPSAAAPLDYESFFGLRS